MHNSVHCYLFLYSFFLNIDKGLLRMTTQEQEKKRKERNEYFREYRKNNKEKIARIQARYYAKKLKELAEENADDE